MVILGIDPGTSISAYVVLDNGTIASHGIEDNTELAAWLRGNLIKPSPDIISCEMLAGMGMIAGREMFQTCMWVGVFKEACRLRNFNLVYRKDIKMHLCRTMRSKDKDVRKALIARWGEQGTKKAKGATYGIHSHEWAALAVATYALDQSSV